jgi:hypothetical protein
MTAASLVAWEGRHRRRSGARRRALVLAALGGAVGAAGAVVGGDAARRVWIEAALVVAAGVAAGGPWRLFWRGDATFLGRLPIAGSALYGLSLWGAGRAAVTALAALAVAAAPFGAVALRFGAFAGLALAAAALVSAAATCAAGAIVVSHQAQAAIRSLSGGQTAPPVVWLAFLPAAGAAGVAWAAWGSVPWLAGGAAPVTLVGALAAAAGLAAAAAPLAARTLAAATREVAALDAVKLAHVDKVGARGLERLWGRVTHAGPVYTKDVALVRRRYPAVYLAAGLVIVAMWATSGDADLAAGGVILLALLVRVHAWLLTTPPTELPRFVRTLPLAGLVRAKRLHLAWRALATISLGVTPALVRTRSWALAAVAVAALVASAWLRQPDDLVQLERQAPPRMP